jgi:flagellar biogenesis protein FliO
MMKSEGQNYIVGNKKKNINTSTEVPSANTATKVSASKASDSKSQQQEPFRNTSAPT